MPSIGFQQHDHDHCIADSIATIEQTCRDGGLRLTRQRRLVLEILLKEHRALGAYEILEVLRQEGESSQPPVAYRALDFLVEHGFAHKVERLNAFIACAHPGEDHAPAILICRACRAVAEAHENIGQKALQPTAEATGFEIETTTIEAVGLCPACKDTPV